MRPRFIIPALALVAAAPLAAQGSPSPAPRREPPDSTVPRDTTRKPPRDTTRRVPPDSSVGRAANVVAPAREGGLVAPVTRREHPARPAVHTSARA